MTDPERLAFERWLNNGHHCGANENMWKAWLARSLLNSATPADQEPVAYLHTLHMEGDQTDERLTFDAGNPFGKPGRDYSAEYQVTSAPLSAQPPQKDADHIEAQSVPVSLYVAACRDFERVAARCDEAAEIIGALQKALAYWMPTVFDERSAHDAYLLMGYTGENEPSYWDGRPGTPPDQAVGLVLTNDQGEKYGALLDSNIAEKTPLYTAPQAPQSDAQSVRDAVIEECAQVVLKAMNDIEIYDLQYPIAIGVIGPVVRELGKASSAIRSLKSAPPQKPEDAS